LLPPGAFVYREGMSHVRALFFARYRDLLGTSDLEVELDRPVPVREFVDALRERGEPFSRLPSDAAVAVNRKVAGPDRPVRPGDEVAFLPPVAGG
jgi:molybdopterin converting factor subunit 1